jgi:DNA repair protein RecO (recombination protein O)
VSQMITLTGMVLASAPAGEYDKRIVLLTKEHGKVTAFVRGARRPKSSLQAATGLFCFGAFEAYAGRTSYTIVKAEISNYFREITGDLDLTYYGCYFLEIADYFCAEEEENIQQLKLLYQALRALIAGRVQRRLIRCIYELKTLSFNGTYPDVFQCRYCGSREHLEYFDPAGQRVVCSSCYDGTHGTHIDASALYTLQYIIASPVEKLFNFRVTDEVYDTVSHIIHRFFHVYLDRPLKSERFLPAEF